MKTNRKFSAGRVVTLRLRSPFHTEAALQLASCNAFCWIVVSRSRMQDLAISGFSGIAVAEPISQIIARRNQIEIQAANAVRIEGTMLVFYAKK